MLVDKAKKAIRSPGLPLVGEVAAGEPVVAEERIEEYLEVPEVIGGETGDYILRVKGDSMKDAGILEGDYVIVRPTQVAGDEEIVVALIEEEATVKRFYKEKEQVRLEPANKAYKPIRTSDAHLLGRVVGMFEGFDVSAVATSERSVLVDDPSVAPRSAPRLFSRRDLARGRSPRRLGGFRPQRPRRVPRLRRADRARDRLRGLRVRALLSGRRFRGTASSPYN